MICGLIEAAAPRHGVPVDRFTRLIWRESSFRPKVTSRAGAQGIAQFMPGTADERGLEDPFDPEEAIPASAALIADLTTRFGNFGLAAAAYNAGPRRVERWLAGDTGLPWETQAYVRFVTGREAEDWKASRIEGDGGQPQSCLNVVAEIRASTASEVASSPYEGTFAPWGVQLVGNYSKDRALAGFEKIRARYGKVMGDAQPLILGTRVGGRGPRQFYRVRVPFQSRKAANALCRQLRKLGGSCIVQRN
ncbi:lytic transglycosylase domain-containing protein [Chthonobacter albigriseus]|uniref:lytic transglycosylase domain-containing protein n=1 Tax=Chthonobacter albigriseus TaxID=1683161 RepID=UPI001FCEDF91|nr:lytic transglycosylase domain-containing protein [Chthonobacter albigriseus]